MDESSAAPTTNPPANPVEQRAWELISSTSTHWEHREGDLGHLLDQVCARLGQLADLELRQALSRATTQVELAIADDGVGDRSQERLEQSLDALEDTASLIALLLDRGEVAKRLIRIDPEPVDLSDLLSPQILDGANGTGKRVSTDVEPALVWADRTKVREALRFTVERLLRETRPEDELRITAAPDGRMVHGCIEMRPPRIPARELIEELEASFTVDRVGIDLAYVRAVLERHGGTVHVVAEPDDRIGLAFSLPLKENDPP